MRGEHIKKINIPDLSEQLKKESARLEKMNIKTPGFGFRIESGPIQFNQDWPGVFVRGDDCVHYWMQLQILHDSLPSYENDGLMFMAKATLKNLIDTLKGSTI